MIPFRFTPRPGTPIFEQAVYAAKRAIVSGQLPAGSPFPSVRALSKGLKINPNTAHKVVAQLVDEGLLAVMPGIGTVVAAPAGSTPRERTRLLGAELEQLVVEAMKLGLDREELEKALKDHWKRLEPEAGR